ncbi:Fukutin-related protein [Chionoecetes opilio]|uniref:Fukutin-related protein n=1 Tax=Chionoecetes opilio TaxID=41210 RepID=A0A8J8WA00_CHIOP|nr:Fukutin-related protein [Chionoecetes opilio]
MFLWRLRLVATWQRAALAMLVVAVTSLCYAYYIYLTIRLPFQLPPIRSEDSISSRRELARRVMRVQRQVEILAVGGVMAPSLPQELRAIALELDPQITTDVTAKPPPLNGSVCPEEYHKGVDTTWYRNFVQAPCDDAPPFREVVTVLLSTKGWAKGRVATVLYNIRKYYDVNVVVLTYGATSGGGGAAPPPATLGVGVSVQASSADTLASAAINKAVAKVKTPFVLVSDSLTHFSGDLCSLERLVRVLEQESEAAAAGGSYRTLDGTWRHGCLQRRMENYQLAYVSGYEHSRHDCMFCDDILGPLVARTAVLRNVTLRETLEGPAMMRDWFVNLRLAGNLTLVCPDVMFFVDAAPTMGRRAWLKVASRWAVQSVWPHDGDKLEFSCGELKMKCVKIRKLVSSFLVPPCCRQAMRHELGFVQECAEKLGLYVELQSGSLLGAVKTDGILPWDFDMDVITDCKEHKVWIKNGTKCLSRKGCRYIQKHGYWMTRCKVSFVDIGCRPDRRKYLPQEYRGVLTRVNYNGRMVNVPPNPALVARNHYGPNYLRHEVHWRYKHKGPWNHCLTPGSHACLENFPSDGNVRFMNFADSYLDGL